MAKSRMYLYSVEWSHGMKQSNLPKSEAMRIVANLLVEYDNVIVTKYTNWKS